MFPQTSTSERSQSTFKKANLAIAELPLDTDDDGIPGEAGVNYPTLHVVPKTAFSCSQQSHNGYYADLETSCQVSMLRFRTITRIFCLKTIIIKRAFNNGRAFVHIQLAINNVTAGSFLKSNTVK